MWVGLPSLDQIESSASGDCSEYHANCYEFVGETSPSTASSLELFPVLLQFVKRNCCSQDGIGGQRDTVDALLYQERTEVWIVARCLTANANLPSLSLSSMDHRRNHAFDCIVSFIEYMSDNFGVSVDAQGQLR